MKIQTADSERVWQSPDKQRTIWDVILSNGTKLQTYSETIATPGWEGEVDTYEKNGKTFIRQAPKADGAPRPFRAHERVFKADPEKQESIEWQAALKSAVETVHGFYELTNSHPKDLATYKAEIVNATITYTQMIERKPDHLVTEPDQLPTDEEIGELEVPFP